VEKRITNPDSLRVKTWRQANRDRYNAYQREYMKRRKEKKNAGPAPDKS